MIIDKNVVWDCLSVLSPLTATFDPSWTALAGKETQFN
jgi:hypothetical protein